MPRRKPDPVEIVGRRIRAFRAEHEMTVEQLGAATGLSGGHVSKLERGIQVPTVKTLAVLADAFGVEAVDLLTDPDASLRHAVIGASGDVDDEALEQVHRRLRRAQLRVIEGDAETGERQKPTKKRRVSRRRRKSTSAESSSGSSEG